MRGKPNTQTVRLHGRLWALIGDPAIARQAVALAHGFGTLTATIASDDRYGRAHVVGECSVCGQVGVMVGLSSPGSPGLGTHDLPELAPVWPSSRPHFCREHLEE